MKIKRLIIAFLAMLPTGPISAMAQVNLLDMDAEMMREPFSGNIGKARKYLFPKGVYEIHKDDSYQWFNEQLNADGLSHLKSGEREVLFDEAIKLLNSRGLIQDQTTWLAGPPSAWGGH